METFQTFYATPSGQYRNGRMNPVYIHAHRNYINHTAISILYIKGVRRSGESVPRRDSFLIGFQVVFSVYDFEVGSCVQIIAQILIALHTLYLSPDHEDLTCVNRSLKFAWTPT